MSVPSLIQKGNIELYPAMVPGFGITYSALVGCWGRLSGFCTDEGGHVLFRSYFSGVHDFVLMRANARLLPDIE
jgi:hypothetical protein